MKPVRRVDKRLVYKAVRRIPKGRVSSYGAVAEEVGVPSAARAIGSIMRSNPYAPMVPCHRVVYSDGRLGGFGGKSHIPEKVRLLRSEGVKVADGRIVDFSNVFYDFRR